MHETQLLLLRGALLTTLLCQCASPPGLTAAQRHLDLGNYGAVNPWVENALREHAGHGEVFEIAVRVALAQQEPVKAMALFARKPTGGRLLTLARATIWAGMRHPSAMMRLEAIQSARRVNADRLLVEMHRRLSDPDPAVAVWAAVALAGTTPGSRALQEHLKDGAPTVRAVAIGQVARLLGDAAYPLFQGCHRSKSAVVRRACASAMAKTRKRALWPALQQLAQDQDASVRHAALRTIGKLGLVQARSVVYAALTDKDLGVRKVALAAYAALAKAAADDTLHAMVEGPNGSLGLVAGRLLAQAGNTQPALNAVARGLVDKSWTVRVFAINTASQLRDPVAWTLCKKGLRDPHPAVRLAAVRLFRAKRVHKKAARMTAHKAFALLCTGANPGPHCVQAAEIQLSFGKRAPLATLLRLLKGAPDANARKGALSAALRHAPKDRRFILAALVDRDPTVALMAAEHVYRLHR